ncbi:pyruvate dehydrogenase (acetyl-transferring) E1 component subunit alpha [Geobacillus icigianus]|uniref:Pyruvate dehydrogenase E1 component subunit alpha n=1 Tax=Geobacillus subterraneus TaxID=129338 RepID=A0A679FNY8_9BACL|nr:MULTISPECIES: pyruvate dehydrogenase (acetyl-transferring) E1 component subunit alpha [Geobacillus]KYD24442.1 Branched-chain alpha-keto acid dehydrogenase, E1 component, alpha subunit [Geobacillus sp. B4113_201601]BBW97763.1 pyruvate dehydrogenase (acetyl-transferring) E1 component subunit alpha [Geobacillus subterraneus]
MFDPNELSIEMVQILDEHGNGDEQKLAAFSDGWLLDAYRAMRRARVIDERLLRMQRQGRIGTYAPFSGQEAAQVGSALALRNDDWIFPSYREVAVCLLQGMPLEQFFYYVQGRLSGKRMPDGVNIFPTQIIIAAQTLHAVGCAWASKLKGEPHVSVAYFGDGATSEGDFHEAMNFAAVYNVPVIFFCQNNQYAISVPYAKQTASRTIAQKALAYGMKGVLVDGNDVLAVYETMRQAVDAARRGEGPMLIEALTYRLGPHTTADDPTKYRRPEEVEAWRRKDPLHRVRVLLARRGLWTEAQEEAFVAEVNAEVTAAYEAAIASPSGSIADVFDHVYSEAPKLLAEQKVEVMRRKQAKGVK